MIGSVNSISKHMRRFLFFGYAVASLLIGLYSFTQVDLSLTLTRVSLWQTIQRVFQSVGFYNRPLSTILYVAILFLLFVLYIVAVRAATSGKLTGAHVWQIVGLVVLILIPSYPAFSYDIFNYMFTAKTVLVYHENPYVILPIAFSGVDPWLSFLHWTHLPSAYTPLWILLTLAPYVFGFRLFLLILWNMKLLVAAFYILSVRMVENIMKRDDPKAYVVSMVMLALNPLIIIESLVSAHNDIAMMAMVLLSVFLLPKKKLVSWFTLSVSIALKFMTITLVPVYLLSLKKRINVPALSLIAISVGLILVLLQREILPWYLVWIVPFVSLLPRSRWLFTLTVGASLGLSLRYAPYLYFGHWNDPVPLLKQWVTILPIAVAVCIVLLKNLRKNLQRVPSQ